MRELDAAKAALARGDADVALKAAMSVLSIAVSDEARIVAAAALRRLGRHGEAAEHLTVVLQAQPANSVVAHNLAAARGDAGDPLGAQAAARVALGLRSRPETWLVLGRARQACGDFDGARQAFHKSVTDRPGYAEALRDLAQLIWMQTGDAGATIDPLQRDFETSGSPEVAALLCGVIRETHGAEAAWAFVRDRANGTHVGLELAAAAAAGAGSHEQLHHARAASRLAPDRPDARQSWITALLAAGLTDQAEAAVSDWLDQTPDDQAALALRQTARRMTADPAALTQGDYRRLVGVYDLAPPPGWPDRTVWLEALSAALLALHDFSAAPFGQSVRAGVQSRIDPRFAGSAVIDETFAVLESALADYVEARPELGAAGHAARIAGAWSVLLKQGGRHSDHIHPQGWISSAFYVRVPEAEVTDKAGWIRFGGLDLGARSLAAEYWVQPVPGRLVLFPSHLWHGTERFTAGGTRLSIAFDAIKA